MSVADSETLHSGKLARLAGVSSDTLRHYERKGLLVSRRASNGYREYGPEALARVRLVQNALSVGFTLDELGRILKVREKGGLPCHDVRALAASKLGALEAQIGALSGLRDELKAMLKTWDDRLERTGRGEPAHLLDLFSASPGRPSKRKAVHR